MGTEQDTWLTNALGITGFDSNQGDTGVQTAGANSSAPTISATSNGDGSFTISGSGFVASATVTVRIVDDALNTLWFATKSNGQGKISMTTASICQRAGRVYFSAIDGRRSKKDLTGNLWSNTAMALCPGHTPSDDDNDDPPDAPDAPDDPPSDPSDPSTPSDPSAPSDPSTPSDPATPSDPPSSGDPPSDGSGSGDGS